MVENVGERGAGRLPAARLSSYPVFNCPPRHVHGGSSYCDAADSKVADSHCGVDGQELDGGDPDKDHPACSVHRLAEAPARRVARSKPSGNRSVCLGNGVRAGHGWFDGAWTRRQMSNVGHPPLPMDRDDCRYSQI